eukprot:scaffold36277_cov117-Isochrysis_galbana.AAC.8
MSKWQVASCALFLRRGVRSRAGERDRMDSRRRALDKNQEEARITAAGRESGGRGERADEAKTRPTTDNKRESPMSSARGGRGWRHGRGCRLYHASLGNALRDHNLGHDFGPRGRARQVAALVVQQCIGHVLLHLVVLPGGVLLPPAPATAAGTSDARV